MKSEHTILEFMLLSTIIFKIFVVECGEDQVLVIPRRKLHPNRKKNLLFAPTVNL